jgi:predicted extracellular nuclease
MGLLSWGKWEIETEEEDVKRTRLALLLVFGMLAALLPVGVVGAATGDPVLINEVLASHTGTDDTEFIELFGTPGTNLSGLSVIVVEGDSFDPGRIDRRFDFKPFHRIGSNGFFLIGNCGGLPSEYDTTPDASLLTDYFENSSLTVALVETNSVAGEGDSVTGSEVVLDTIALNDGDAGDTFYFEAPVIGPDGTFFPAGARRVADGVDTDTASDWVIGSFFLPGANTPMGAGFDGCAPIPLTIPEIQGDSQFSIYDGEVATTTGVVTAITANGRDMWIQDVAGDGNPATSDGIFVDDRDDLDPLPEVGDEVTVTATIEEQQFGNALPLTRLNNPDPDTFAILSGGNALPMPIELGDLPDEVLADGIAFWERLEGMRVSVKDGRVVAPTTRFGEFGMLAKKNAKKGSGYEPSVKQILLRSIGPNAVDYNPERILVDDATLADPIQVRPGDRVKNLVGVVDYTFGAYKLQPTSFDAKTKKLPKAPVSKRSGDDADTVITTYNVENLFDLVPNPDKDDGSSTPTPAELETQLTKLALSIEEELELPEIMVLQEVENEEIAQELGDRVNAATGTNYVAKSFETSDGRGIEVAFLYDDDRVDLLDVFQLSGLDVEAAFGPSSPSPGREPLYGKFQIGDEIVHIVGNHFKSKGGDDPPFGVNDPFIRVTEVQRKAQAQVVRDFVDGLLVSDSDALVMITGDLNDFQFGEPGEGPDHPIAILEGFGGDDPFTNLIEFEKAKERWTFIFDGNSQVLDHMLVNDALLEYFEGVDILHFNVSFPSDIGEDATTAIRASDHDPIEGRFGFDVDDDDDDDDDDKDKKDKNKDKDD